MDALQNYKLNKYGTELCRTGWNNANLNITRRGTLTTLKVAIALTTLIGVITIGVAWRMLETITTLIR